jgi:hypothetical protein
MSATHSISFAASSELVDALDEEAFAADMSRAALIRLVLVAYFRSTGGMSHLAAPTTALARSNRRYVSGGRP